MRIWKKIASLAPCAETFWLLSVCCYWQWVWATLLEANTFIFKIGFENSKGLGYLLFLGVVTLTIRYYLCHYIMYNSMICGLMKWFVIIQFLAIYVMMSTGLPRGLLSNIETFSHGFLESQDEGENSRNEFVFKYEVVSGIFRRAVSYTCDCRIPTRGFLQWLLLLLAFIAIKDWV